MVGCWKKILQPEGIKEVSVLDKDGGSTVGGGAVGGLNKMY